MYTIKIFPNSTSLNRMGFLGKCKQSEGYSRITTMKLTEMLIKDARDTYSSFWEGSNDILKSR